MLYFARELEAWNDAHAHVNVKRSARQIAFRPAHDAAAAVPAAAAARSMAAVHVRSRAGRQRPGRGSRRRREACRTKTALLHLHGYTRHLLLGKGRRTRSVGEKLTPPFRGRRRRPRPSRETRAGVAGRGHRCVLDGHTPTAPRNG